MVLAPFSKVPVVTGHDKLAQMLQASGYAAISVFHSALNGAMLGELIPESPLLSVELCRLNFSEIPRGFVEPEKCLKCEYPHCCRF